MKMVARLIFSLLLITLVSCKKQKLDTLQDKTVNDIKTVNLLGKKMYAVYNYGMDINGNTVYTNNYPSQYIYYTFISDVSVIQGDSAKNAPHTNTYSTVPYSIKMDSSIIIDNCTSCALRKITYISEDTVKITIYSHYSANGVINNSTYGIEVCAYAIVK